MAFAEQTRSCATELVCRDCGQRLPLPGPPSKCLGCGQGFDIDYDYEQAKARIAELPISERAINIWRFEELLPILDARAPPAGAGGERGRSPAARPPPWPPHSPGGRPRRGSPPTSSPPAPWSRARPAP